MTKLKCWKKDEHPIRGNLLFIKNYEMDSEDRMGVIKKNKEWVIYHGGPGNAKLTKSFKSKSNAISFSNKYMKSHDKC